MCVLAHASHQRALELGPPTGPYRGTFAHGAAAPPPPSPPPPLQRLRATFSSCSPVASVCARAQRTQKRALELSPPTGP